MKKWGVLFVSINFDGKSLKCQKMSFALSAYYKFHFERVQIEIIQFRGETETVTNEI